ncbi:MAG: hypothetical protein EYC69_06560 [Bacteroidetes bacterium]|nr:MAG: hypothetical protein EYC69_06560 [Bacteroidota bacterium]
MKIKNQEDLSIEIKRLEEKSKSQEQYLLAKVHTLRERYTPVNMILNSLSSLTGIPLNKSELLKKGTLVSLTFIAQALMRKSELKLETLVADFLNKAVEKIKNIFSSKDEPENQADAEVESAN